MIGAWLSDYSCELIKNAMKNFFSASDPTPHTLVGETTGNVLDSPTTNSTRSDILLVIIIYRSLTSKEKCWNNKPYLFHWCFAPKKNCGTNGDKKRAIPGVFLHLFFECSSLQVFRFSRSALQQKAHAIIIIIVLRSGDCRENLVRKQ
jgi:hypothetical protein